MTDRSADARTVLPSSMALTGAITTSIAARLADAIPTTEWVTAPTAEPPAEGAVCDLQRDDTLVDGAYRLEVAGSGPRTRITVTGGGRAGLVQGVEALVRGIVEGGTGPELRTGTVEAEPALPYRLFWTWDHSTHWDPDSFGQQETGAFNPYSKQPDAFVTDYQRMIDFLALHGIGGVIVYGLLRDSHGGVEAANQVCRYARERGVRIVAGIAINAYGGIYYEGDHPYNLATWLRQHPELSVDTSALPGFRIDDYGYLAFPQGDYTMAARSDSPAGEQWHLEGIDWLLDTVDVDGINIEFGDYAGNDPVADMRRLLPGLVDRALARRPDLWLIADVGWDNVLDPAVGGTLDGLPDSCAYQFTYNRSYWPRLRSELGPAVVERLPTRANLIRPHAGSQWNRQRHADMTQHYAELGSLAQRSGLSGATIFGEASPYHVTNELNYIAFARFTREVDLAWETFLREEVDPRLGGPDAAARFLRIVGHIDRDDLAPPALREMRDQVRSTAAALPDPARTRWGWLEERLSRRIHARGW